MDYPQAVDYLRSLSDLERAPAEQFAAVNFDLRRVHALLDRLDDPHRGRPTVHVAGSKGKGTVAALAQAALTASGVCTGLYISPHLHSYCERISVDGQAVPPARFSALVEAVLPAVTAENTSALYGRVSAFEALTAAAFLHFRQVRVNWQVLEVGLGGRLDATNVVPGPKVSVLTRIGLEHTAILGDTLEAIAGEKAGIIGPGDLVVMAPQRERAAAVFRGACRDRGARLTEVAQACRLRRGHHGPEGQDFELRTERGFYRLHLPLVGRHQLDNAATAVIALEAAADLGAPLTPEGVREGFRGLRWPGRVEVIHRRPSTVVDVAHTEDSARALCSALTEDLAVERAVFVVGMLDDKPLEAVAAQLAPLATEVVAVAAPHPRALPAAQVAAAFAALGVPASTAEGVAAGMDAAEARAGAQGWVVVTGSFAVAAEARAHLLGLAPVAG